MKAQQAFNLVVESVQKDFHLDLSTRGDKQDEINAVVESTLSSLPQEKELDAKTKNRVQEELFGMGPITSLLKDSAITEIFINGRSSIWFERNGKNLTHDDEFFSDISFNNFVHRICQLANIHFNKDLPCADGSWGNFRVHVIAPPLAETGPFVSLRRHPDNPWSFSSLLQHNWASDSEIDKLRQSVQAEHNTLIIGPTGSGKTSVLNAFLQEVESNTRVIAIEDASEIKLPNSASVKLLTRIDPQGQFREYSPLHLIKQSLRMRPQRIVVGEVRGPEAKDFLMALSTGHKGGLCTLHAESPTQALLRLEMLVQLGAPNWNLMAIRHLIRLSLDRIVVVKNENGRRILDGIYQISSLEEQGFLLDRC